LLEVSGGHENSHGGAEEAEGAVINDCAQARRGHNVRLGTRAQPRRCLKQHGYAQANLSGCSFQILLSGVMQFAASPKEAAMDPPRSFLHDNRSRDFRPRFLVGSILYRMSAPPKTKYMRRALVCISVVFFTLSPALVPNLSVFANEQANTAGVPAPASDEAIRQSWNGWNAPVKPFRIIGNIYYVGVAGVSSFLITTPQGHILIDTGFEMTVPRITNSLAELGFRLRDVKILLSSHAHLDHTGGHARMKSLTGARICTSEADGALLASGGTADFTPYTTNMTAYPPVSADRIVRDGDKVELGGVTLVCHLTPGHTKGCTTWTMDVEEGGQVYHVLFFGSTTVLDGVRLQHNAKYPSIAEDYAASFKKLKSLPCDVFLAPHAGFFGLPGKASRLARGEKPNPFIDPKGYRNFIDESEQAFERCLRREKSREQ